MPGENVIDQLNYLNPVRHSDSLGMTWILERAAKFPTPFFTFHVASGTNLTRCIQIEMFVYVGNLKVNRISPLSFVWPFGGVCMSW